MRIFTGLKEAVNEIERDLHEMGTLVHPQSYQDQLVEDKPEFETKELQGYSYQIVHPEKVMDEFKELGGNSSYVLQEVVDRISSEVLNPGNAYVHRKDVWEQFLHNGKFSYTYNERFNPQLDLVVQQLLKNPDTRQAVLTIYDQNLDRVNMGGKKRIPCSMYYQFLRRNRKGINYLDIIYTMRSCDFYTHFIYDVTMACLLRNNVSSLIGIEPGYFTHFIGSLHFYKKDCKKEIF